MSNYKKVDAVKLDSDLNAVADKIREKTGGTDELAFPEGFIESLDSITGGASLEACTVTLKDEYGSIYYATGTTVIDGAEAPFSLINDYPYYCANQMVEQHPSYNYENFATAEARFPLVKGSFFHIVIDGQVDMDGMEISGDCEYVDWTYEGANDIYIHSFKISGDCEIKVM